ncbi:hypothetical protein E2C01_015565 [Portunus trituberculatus]|uniref:Uncharacterized protein n=1 Tax=Portunus trituberculatus TaxID=210409 RepID=A0A5B7DM90_PORTR|nr:hypothetical protein [Portunus trituberculatus]
MVHNKTFSWCNVGVAQVAAMRQEQVSRRLQHWPATTTTSTTTSSHHTITMYIVVKEPARDSMKSSLNYQHKHRNTLENFQ